MDVFDAMTDAEWAFLCRMNRSEAVKFSECSAEEKAWARGFCEAGFWKLVKVGGHKWFVSADRTDV